MAVCLLGRKLIPQDDVRHSTTGTITNTLIGAHVGLIVTSVVVTVTFTIVGTINNLPDPLVWAALISGLGGSVVGATLGATIGTRREGVWLTGNTREGTAGLSNIHWQPSSASLANSTGHSYNFLNGPTRSVDQGERHTRSLGTARR
jgi:hypothetical protein